MKDILRILSVAVMTIICGGALYGIIYFPRFFKVLAILVLLLTVYLLYSMIKQWVGSRADKGGGRYVDAEIVDEEK